MIAGLNLVWDLGAREVKVKTYSQLIVSQVKRKAQVKDALLQKYVVIVKEKIDNIDSLELVPTQGNKIKSGRVVQIGKHQINGDNHSIVQETLERPSYDMNTLMMVAVAEPAQET